MRYKKTPLGMEAMKIRGTTATQTQRTALIMVDGKKTAAEILAAMSGIGLTNSDIEKLVELGYITPADGPQAVAASKDAGITAAPEITGLATPTIVSEPVDNLTEQEMYQRAYPIATKLTSGLGLRGFRLNLSLESVGNYSDLVKLAPKILDAVGEAKYAELKAALRM